MRQMHPSEEIHVNASLVFNFERSLGSIPSEAAAATFARIFFRPMVLAIFPFNIFHWKSKHIIPWILEYMWLGIGSAFDCDFHDLGHSGLGPGYLSE